MAIGRTAWTDDDGTGTTGTILNNAAKTSLYDQIDAAILGSQCIVQTDTSTGTVNDFALTSGATLLRMNNATLTTLTGLAAGVDGQVLDIMSVGAGQVDVANQNTGSAAANRIINGISCVRSLSPGLGRIRLVYDGTTDRWRVTSHEQGAAITPTFSAAYFTGSDSMTWTVAAGDVTCFSYVIEGNTMTVWYDIRNTTVGGTPSTGLQITLPVSASAGAITTYEYSRNFDNGAAGANGVALVTTTLISIYRDVGASTNWSASTDQTTVQGKVSVAIA